MHNPDLELDSTFQILFYALRPGLVRSQTPTMWHLLNLAVQVVFDVIIVKFMGLRALGYFLMSSFLAGSLHPCAAHFIAEHYLWDGLEQETYSYYGPLNILAYNVCSSYHGLASLLTFSRLDTTTNTTTSPRLPGRSYRLCAHLRLSFMTQFHPTHPGRWLSLTLSVTQKWASSRVRNERQKSRYTNATA